MTTSAMSSRLGGSSGKHRAYCASARWNKNYDKFLFGTVFADSELEAEPLLHAAWATICPHQIEWLAIIPGGLVFHEDSP